MAKNNLSHDPMATANAAAATTAVVFIACRLLVSAFPGGMFTLAQSWFHGVQLARMMTWNTAPTTFVLGLVSSALFGWVVGYVFALFYNIFTRR